MSFLNRIGRTLLQLVIFLVLLSVLSKGITFVTAERYTGVGEPNRLFPIVAVPQSAEAIEGQDYPKYQLLYWGRLRELPPAPRFRLAETEGEFELPAIGEYVPLVRFSASPEADGRSRIRVKVTDDDYVLYSTYLTDGSTITPVSFRIWGPSSMLLALIPAAVLTWVFNRMVAWWRRRREPAVPQE